MSAMSNFAELQDAIARRLGRNDMAEEIIECIDLAEHQIEREAKIRAGSLVTSGLLVADQAHLQLPNGFREADLLEIDADPEGINEIVSLDVLSAIRARFPSGGKPYAMSFYGDNQLQLGPVPNSAFAYKLFYRGMITQLSASTTTSWLLTNAPDVQLYCALYHTTFHTGDTEQRDGWREAYQSGIPTLRAAEARARMGGGPLRIRPDIMGDDRHDSLPTIRSG